MEPKVHVARPASDRWPIAAAMLAFPDSHDGQAETWRGQLAEVAFEGFADVDLTDSWVRIGDLSPARRADLADALREAGLRSVAVSAIRCSVLDPEDWEDNLAYSHRTLDAAAELGCEVVSVGLHRPLTASQRAAFWFWTGAGPVEVDSPDIWRAAVDRLRELGRHAGDVGLQLSLEMYEDTLLGTSQSAVRLVQEIGLDNVGLNPDLANIFRLHRDTEPFQEAVRACLPWANYWHVKSYYRDVDPATGAHVSVPAPMSSGSMDYRRAIKEAIACGFAGPFCVEHYGGDGLTVMADNQRYVRRMLAVALGEVRPLVAGAALDGPPGGADDPAAHPTDPRPETRA
jgi:sugar phosphate isomerase/epimerase